MPPALRKAHQANDRAVLAAYGFPRDLPEEEIVARLFGVSLRPQSRVQSTTLSPAQQPQDV